MWWGFSLLAIDRYWVTPVADIALGAPDSWLSFIPVSLKKLTNFRIMRQHSEETNHPTARKRKIAEQHPTAHKCMSRTGFLELVRRDIVAQEQRDQGGRWFPFAESSAKSC